MAKYSPISNEERQNLLSEFCESLAVIKTTDEAMKFLTDLLTRQEIVFLAKRIKIAKFLIAGKGYRYIQEALRVSHGTIAKVSQWLLEAGEGFKLIAERTKKEKKELTGTEELRKMEWERFKRSHSLMFWPELLIKDIVKIMDKKQREKVKDMIAALNYKSRLYKELSKIV
jgi:TrpR-related protein YerC/YecD